MDIQVTKQTTERGTYSLTLKFVLNYLYTQHRQTGCQNPMVELISKININDRIKFQAMFIKFHKHPILNFVKFINLNEKDETVYNIQYKQTMENATNVINKQIAADDSWHSVGNVVIPATYIVELKITMAPLMVSNAAIHDDTHFTDFELRGVDGSVHMHKSVAAVSSPYFKTLFTGSWQETTDRIVDVPDTSVATLQQLKDYMYLGTVSGDTRKLLLLSSLYMMPDLEKRCVFELSENVTSETAYDLISFAANHKMAQLLFEILGLIQNGTLDVNEMIDQHNPC